MLEYIAAGLNIMGGLSDYKAAKLQAAVEKQKGRIDNAIGQANSVALLEQGLYNSTVKRNNGIAKANDTLYQNSIISSNRQLLIQQAQMSKDVALDKIRGGVAQARVQNVNLSADVIRSIELEEFNKLALQDVEIASELQSMEAQMNENQRTAKLQRLYSDVDANMSLLGSRNDAFYSRLNGRNAEYSANMRSKQIKHKARGDLFGTFAQSVSMVASAQS